MNAHFERKLKLFSYSKDDALEDATLIMGQTKDPGSRYGCLDLIHTDKCENLKAALHDHYTRVNLIDLGVSMTEQVLGNIHVEDQSNGDVVSSNMNTKTAGTKLCLPSKVGDYLLATLSLRCISCTPGTQPSANVVNAANLLQAKKDVERDRLLIDGRYVVGAESGMIKIQELLLSVCEQKLSAFDSNLLNGNCSADSSSGSNPVIATTLPVLIQRALIKASRTNSAGSAFIELKERLSEKEMPIPLNDLAPPLCMRVFVGARPLGAEALRSTTSSLITSAGGSGKGGSSIMMPTVTETDLALVCEVECTTFYRIIQNTGIDMDEDGDGYEEPGRSGSNPSYVVRLVFTDSVFMPLRMHRDRQVFQLYTHVLDGAPSVSIALCDHK